MRILIIKQTIEMKLIFYQIELQITVLFQNKIKAFMKNQEFKKAIYPTKYLIKMMNNLILHMKMKLL